MIRLSSQDRNSLIRLASSLPKGDETRRAILSGLKDAEAEHSGSRTSARRDLEEDDMGGPPRGGRRKGDPEETRILLDEFKGLERAMPNFMREFERRFYNRARTWTDALRAIQFEGLGPADFEGMERYMNRGEPFESILSKAFKKRDNRYRNYLLKPSSHDKVW